MASWILSFASSRVSWCSIGDTLFVCHLRRALYVFIASRAWSLAPSCSAGWFSSHLSSSIGICSTWFLPASANMLAFSLPSSFSLLSSTHLNSVFAGLVLSLLMMPLSRSEFCIPYHPWSSCFADQVYFQHATEPANVGNLRLW